MLIRKPVNEAGVDSVFIIKEKGWVHACIDLNNKSQNKKKLKISVDWIGPDGKSFYRKQSDLAPADIPATISSAISLSPDKRQPGTYFVRVYLFDKRIAEKKFELHGE